LITITHTHAEGTLADGAHGTDGSGEILGHHGFIWFPSMDLYGIRDSRDRAARRRAIHAAAEELRAAGFAAEISIDDTPRDYETVQLARHERLEDRRAGFERRSERLGNEASALLKRSDERVEGIPLGQPVFAGKRGSWLRTARSQAADEMIRAGQVRHEAMRQGERASASLAREKHGQSPDVIARRVERLERELRALDRALGGPGNHQQPATGLYAEELTAQCAVLLVQLTGDRAALDQARAEGTFGRWTKGDLHPGDLLRIRDEWRQLVRANTKSVSVTTGYSWTNRYGYEQITNVRCPHRGEAQAPSADGAPDASTPHS